MSILLAALALLGNPSVRPWPVGPGPRYLPTSISAAVEAGKPVGSLHCEPPGPSFAVHVELFVGRRVVIVPAGIGVAAPLLRSGATVVPRGCVYPLHTVAPDGVVEVSRGATLTLTDLFAVWGQPFGARRLASFRGASPLRAYIDGRRVPGFAGAIALFPHAEIVLELGRYVAPHPIYLFPGGSS